MNAGYVIDQWCKWYVYVYVVVYVNYADGVLIFTYII